MINSSNRTVPELRFWKGAGRWAPGREVGGGRGVEGAPRGGGGGRDLKDWNSCPSPEILTSLTYLLTVKSQTIQLMETWSL